MRRLGLAVLLASGAFIGVAQAADYGCKHEYKKSTNHNAKDPSRPGTIGGCGTGQYKLDNFQDEQNQLKNKQMMTGPQRLDGGSSF